ncbi:Replication factor C subunit 3 [Linum perenne]
MLSTYKFVFRIKMPSDVRVKLINDIADIKYKLSFGCNEKLQLGSLIASFTGARSALVAAAKCQSRIML